jgi:hypothetical protein
MARLAVALYLGNRVEALPGISDQISYHTLAMRVHDGHGFSFATGWWPATPAGEPTAHWSYLYVLFLALVYSVFGPLPLAARLIQAVITGVLQPLLSYRIGSRLFGRRAGLVSAALAAINGYFVFYSGALMTESVYIVAMLWIIDICTSERRYSRASMKTWFLLGLALSTAVLFRQVLLLLVPVFLGWVAWRMIANRSASPVQAAGRVAVSLAVLAVCILPWTIRNYRVFDTFVLLNTNAGFAFYWANHPIHGTHFMPLLSPDKPSYGELIPAELRTLNEGAMDRALLKRGIGFVVADPVRYVRLSASRVSEYFRFWPSPNAGVVSNSARVLSFGLCLPFLLAGLAISLAKSDSIPGSSERTRNSVLFVIVIASLYTLLHLLSWTLIRYRLPIDAITVPFTALGMTAAYDRLAAAVRPIRIPVQPTSASSL